MKVTKKEDNVIARVLFSSFFFSLVVLVVLFFLVNFSFMKVEPSDSFITVNKVMFFVLTVPIIFKIFKDDKVEKESIFIAIFMIVASSLLYYFDYSLLFSYLLFIVIFLLGVALFLIAFMIIMPMVIERINIKK